MPMKVVREGGWR